MVQRISILALIMSIFCIPLSCGNVAYGNEADIPIKRATLEQQNRSMMSKIDSILRNEYKDAIVKGKTCFLIGEIEFIGKGLLANDDVINTKAEKKLRKKILKFLNKRDFYCNNSNWPYLVDFVGSWQKKILFKRLKRFKAQISTWIAKHTQEGWIKKEVPFSVDKEITLALTELNAIGPQLHQSILNTWKPRACRYMGFVAARQNLLNTGLSDDMVALPAFEEANKSKDSILVEVCDGIRQGAKFDQEVQSWVDNLKWLGRRDSNPRPID